VSEGEAPGKAPQPDQRQPKRSTTIRIETGDGLAEVVIVHIAGWKLRFLVDSDPCNGVLRDIEELAQRVNSRRAA